MNKIATTLLVFFMFGIVSIQSQINTNKRTEWFTDSRYGMFIHWGIYSGAEGYWRGEKLRHDNNYAEWLFYRNRISKSNYLLLLDRFQWDEIDPEEWVVLAKNAGMKYIVFTAKHHDGFALWNSKVGTYNIGVQTGYKRDIVEELADACQKHDIKLGFYYSHWVDWEHQYGWDHSKEIKGLKNEQYDIYWQEKVIPQVRELLSNYGDICMMWFDMWINHSESVVSKEQLLQLKSMIRELQPNCLVNSRLGLSIEEDPDIDFKTLLDNQLGQNKEDFPWQSPATVAHSWGMHRSDTKWKSSTTLINSLVNNVSLNGNFLLNIGPRANGEVQYEVKKRLLEVGEWLSVNGESVYGCEAFDLPRNLHDWGHITTKKTEQGRNLYLHVMNWPLDRQISLTGVTNKPDRIYLLNDKQKKALDFIFKATVTHINLPVMAADRYSSVIVVEYDKEPDVITDLVALSVEGGYSMTPFNHKQRSGDLKLVNKQKYGTIPAHALINSPTTLTWRVYVESPGIKKFSVSYSFQDKEGKSQLSLEAAGNKMTHVIKNTGKTVGESNEDWVIDDYRQFELGEISFSEAGFYDVVIGFDPHRKDEVKFQWLWME